MDKLADMIPAFICGMFFTVLVAVAVTRSRPSGEVLDETCAPYQALHQFSDRGHDLVVCRLPQGLVVREVVQ